MKIATLIEDYKRRLKVVTGVLETSNNSGSIDDIKKFARLNAKAGEYRTFIAELEKLEPDDSNLTKDRVTTHDLKEIDRAQEESQTGFCMEDHPFQIE